MSRIEIGKIVNTHGVRGDVKINPFVDDSSVFTEFEYLIVGEKEYNVKGVKFVKATPIVSLEGIDSIEKAEMLRNTGVFINEEDLPELTDGEYYIKDILGLEVITEEGEILGKVTNVFKTGSNDVYEVSKEGSKPVLIPAISEVVKTIDIENGEIRIHLLEGLI